MSASPVLNPELPYVGEVEGGMTPGKMVKIQGKVPPESSRFAINYQLGPNLNPRDDIAIHVSPRFREGFITRNHIESMTWGPEENEGGMWIQPGSHFEIILLCEYNCYKIAVNGKHFAEFNHRLPYSKVTHLTIDGEVEISSVFYETINIGPRPSAPVPDVPPVDVGPPPPGGLYPTLNPQDFPNPQDKYGPPPGGYRNNPTPAQPYRQKTEQEEDAYGSCLDKVGLAVGGLVAAGGVAAAMHAYNKSKKKQQQQQESGEYHEKTEHSENESGLNLGALGAALASSLASNAFDRNAHAQQGYPPQDSSSGVLGSILGALGGGGGMHPQGGYQQPAPPQADPLGGLGSILGGVLGGGGHHQSQQPQYQPSGGYGSGPGYQQSQGGGPGGDLFGGLGGALFSAAMDGLTKKSHKSQPHFGGGGDQDYNNYNPHPPPPSRSDHEVPPSYAPHRPPSPPPPGGSKLSAADISKGLGLGDDDD